MRSQSSSSADFTMPQPHVIAGSNSTILPNARRRAPRAARRSAARSSRPCRPARRVSPVRAIARADRGLPAPRDLRVAREPPRLRHMVVILHEQRVAPRPASARRPPRAVTGQRGEPLHRRAEAVGAAEHQMIAAGFASSASTARAAAPSRLARSAGSRPRRCAQALANHSIILCHSHTPRSRIAPGRALRVRRVSGHGRKSITAPITAP